MFYKFRISLLEPLDKSSLSAWANGISASFFFEGDSRVNAFIAAHDWYTKLGFEVTVLAASPEQEANPLGFSSQELLRIKERGVDLKLGFNESALQFESIEVI